MLRLSSPTSACYNYPTLPSWHEKAKGLVWLRSDKLYSRTLTFKRHIIFTCHKISLLFRFSPSRPLKKGKSCFRSQAIRNQEEGRVRPAVCHPLGEEELKAAGRPAEDAIREVSSETSLCRARRRECGQRLLSTSNSTFIEYLLCPRHSVRAGDMSIKE